MRLSLIVVALAEANIVGSVNHEIRGVNIITFHCGFEQFWLVDDAVCFESQNDVLNKGRVYVRVCSPLLHIVDLNGQVMLQLAFFQKEVCFITVVKMFLIGGKRMAREILKP